MTFYQSNASAEEKRAESVHSSYKKANVWVLGQHVNECLIVKAGATTKNVKN